MLAFRELGGDPSPDRVQIDIHQARRHRLFIEQPLHLEPPLPKPAGGPVFPIGEPATDSVRNRINQEGLESRSRSCSNRPGLLRIASKSACERVSATSRVPAGRAAPSVGPYGRGLRAVRNCPARTGRRPAQGASHSPSHGRRPWSRWVIPRPSRQAQRADRSTHRAGDQKNCWHIGPTTVVFFLSRAARPGCKSGWPFGWVH